MHNQKIELFFPRYKLKSYEYELAKMEIKRFLDTDSQIIEEQKKLIIKGSFKRQEQFKHLTYFSKIVFQDGNTKRTIIPNQVYLENATEIYKNRNKLNLVNLLNNTTKKRQFRYLTHKFHEYKGRFYPQLVKSLINYSNLENNSIILDPFCGSGTTLIESYLLGYDAIGIDLNPLACLISKTKVNSMEIELEDLKKEKMKVFNQIKKQFEKNRLKIFNNNQNLNSFLNESKNVSNKTKSNLLKFIENGNYSVPEYPDIPNIFNWFDEVVLKKLLIIRKIINQIEDERIKSFFLVALSSIIIDVSYQDPEQLRIMRKKIIPKNIPVFPNFKNVVEEFYLILKENAFIRSITELKNSNIKVFNANTKHLDMIEDNSIDLIVTSPPYATALPYIDTDRLSLYILDFVNRNDIKELNLNMIGNREITKRYKDQLEKEFLNNIDKLPFPISLKDLLLKIIEINDRSNVGFRRRNKPYLLYKYFYDMYQALKEWYKKIKENKNLFIVLGKNKTKADGLNEIIIDTDDFIFEIAKIVGFKAKKQIYLSSAPSYMIHQKKSIKDESILFLKK